MRTNTPERIAQLRRFMKERQLSAFIIPSSDPHSGEYVPQHWKAREWLSGFTGSAGTVVITLAKGGLWTDSRYFIQAEEQLHGTGISLFKEQMSGTPTISQWLKEELHPGDCIGIDGWVNSFGEIEKLQQEVQEKQLHVIATEDPFAFLWKNRPNLPLDPIFILPLQYTGTSCIEKIDRIRTFLKQNLIDGILISALDEIAWTLNLRGNDVHCNPVFLSYLFITDTHVTLYIDNSKITSEVEAYLTDKKVSIRPYQEVEKDLKRCKGKRIQLSPNINYRLYQTLASQNIIHQEPSPVIAMKAIKNSTEIAGIHEAMKRDGIAMTNFLYWLQSAVLQGTETEMSISRKLYECRANQDNFKGISFDTIAGYQAHGAIVHYEATPITDATLQPEGMLLLDSGAQYLEGTTDITRTIPLGPITPEQKKDYTLVLKGFIALSQIEFPHGTCGTQLDILARQFMWKEGMNYGHGTGHGVGHFLNVHEGPHQIRMNHVPCALLPGMTITNEPGIYKTGRYGIRIENTMLVVPSQTTEFGTYYKFEPLTLCPICQEAILPELMTKEEKDWLNAYHQKVYESLSPFLDEKVQYWLKQACKTI